MHSIAWFYVGLIATADAASNALAANARETEWFYLEMTTAYFGVPFNVLMAASFGSLVGVLKNKKDSHSDVIVAFLGSVVLSVFVSVVGPILTGYSYDSTGVQAIVTMMLAYTSQSWGSILLDEIGPAMKEFFKRVNPYSAKDGTK
ncbi:holin [Xanthomonas phage XAJ2]|uniref:Holin n=1 Tax=Xanthomonas phage XAJ2 TaxID=1775249 RepID=A0A1I9L2K2_9CAUD|nr:holin [Xanthomonas phage XAJ2]